MSFEILGIGLSVPDEHIEQSDAAVLAQQLCGDGGDHSRAIGAIYRRTHVDKRHSVLLESSTNGEPACQSFYAPAISTIDRGPSTSDRMAQYAAKAGPLATQAAQPALEQANIEPSQITHLVTVSCTGFGAPGFDMYLVRELGLSLDVQRSHIGFMGCHGAMNGLRVAKAFADADANACVLVCAAELCSLHQQYGVQADRIVSNALFADGAAAIIGRQASTSTDASSWQLAASSSTIVPGTESHMKWTIGDSGFEMTLSPQVPDTIRQHLPKWLAGWLAEHRLNIQDIGCWAIHPGGPKILQACQESLDLNDDCLMASRSVLADLGNMSSPTILFIFERLRQRNATGPCVVLGFGPGLTVEAALIR